MLPAIFHRLTVVAAGFRSADQLMVAGTPLVVAALFGAGPEIVGLIVAIQGSAWLLVSLPVGVMVDRIAPLVGMKRGMVLAVAGVAVAMAGLALHNLPLFAMGTFVSASAAVVGFLSESASVQSIVPGTDLPRANARLQLVQSAAMLAGPAIMGYAVLKGLTFAAYGLALALAVAGLIVAIGFGSQPSRLPKPRAPKPHALLSEIAEGFDFVRAQPLLMGIVACALFWNMAFFALMAVFVPFALGPVGLDAGQAGLAQSAMGIGSLAAALTAAHALSKLSPRVILAFGPASSLVASILLVLSPSGSIALPVISFALLGFGPILWFVCQNSIRQLVTPAGLLGRVGSVIQVAIYGVRSIGALVGGIVAARAGFDAALMMVVVLFALSAASVFGSALGSLREMPSALRA